MVSSDLGSGGLSGCLVGYAEHLIDFSRIRIAGWSIRLLVSLILILFLLGVLGIYIMATKGFSDEVFAGVLALFSMALIFSWILSWGRRSSVFRGTRFSLKYAVRALENRYTVDLGLSALSIGMVSVIRVYVVTAYSYSMVKPRYRGVRVLCNGGIIDREIVLEDMVYEGYSRNVSFNPRSLECTTCINIRSVRGLFRFTTGSFVVVEAVARNGARAYAVVPITYTPLFNGGRSIASVEGAKAEVSVDSTKARVELWLQGERQYSSAEIGLLYTIEASFASRERYRRVVKIPLASIKLLGRNTCVEINPDHMVKKMVGKIVFKPREQAKPCIDQVSPAESYACNASVENLYLPPVYTSRRYSGISIRVGYYIRLRSMLKSKRLFIESPLPPNITKPYALGRK